MNLENKKIKIGYILNSTTIGGAEINLLNFLKLSKNKSLEHHLIFFNREDNEKGDLFPEFNRLKIDIYDLKAKNKLDITALIRLHRYLKKKKIDIIHSQLPYSNIIAKIIGKLNGKIVINTEVNTKKDISKGFTKITVFIDKITFFLADFIICNAKAVEKSFFSKKESTEYSKNILLKRKHATIYYGLDIESIKEKIKKHSIKTIKKELNIKNDEIIISNIGSLTKQKGQKNLILAIKKLKEKYNIKCFIVGDGILRKDLELLIKSLNLNNNVELLGYRKNILSILKITDIFVFPSLWEGLPNTLLNVAIAEIPMIASDLPGIKEIIKNNESGFIVPINNVKILAKSIENLITNKSLQKKFIKNANLIIKKRFDMRKTVKNLEEIYCELYRKRI